MATVAILLTEVKQRSDISLYQKLSRDAKRLALLFCATIKKRNIGEFTVNMIRNTGSFGSSSQIRNLLYELESRYFGEVKIRGAEVSFIADEQTLRSIG